MFRQLSLTLLLTASLLACPFRCLGALGPNVGSPEAAVAGCACCHDDEATSCPESGVPEDDCSCPNCLCDGAVLAVGEAVVNLSPTTGHTVAYAVVTDRFRVGAPAGFPHGFRGAGPRESGRTICYRHCLLLV